MDELLPGRISPYLYTPDEFVMIPSRAAGLANFLGLKHELTKDHKEPIFRQKPCNETVIGDLASRVHSIECRNNGLTAVVFRDSFFLHLQHYFTRYFKSATYISGQASLAGFEKFIGEKKPDIVIEELVERLLPIKIDKQLDFIGSKQLFELSNELLLSIGDIVIENIKTNKSLNVSVLPGTEDNRVLSLNSTGPDPKIILTNIGFDAKSRYIIKIRIHSEKKDLFQLFYSKKGYKRYPFSQSNSVRHSLKKGENEFYILLDDMNLGDALRIDPGFATGRFRITAFEVRREFKIKSSN